MPIRFEIDGQSWEVDTPEEAIRLKLAVVNARPPAKRGPGRPPKIRPEETQQAPSPISPKLKRSWDEVFLPEDAPFVNALLASPGIVTTDQFMELLKLTPLGVPPRFTAWRLRAKKHGLKFNDILTRRDKYINRKVRSVYKLTAAGRVALEKLRIVTERK